MNKIFNIALVGTFTLLSGCLSFDAKPDNSRFYKLSSTVPQLLIWHETPPAAGPVLGIARVTLPGYLNRSTIAARQGSSEILYSNNKRWVETLSNNIGAVIAENLHVLLNSQTHVAPWRKEIVRDFDVILTVKDFIALKDENVIVLTAQWEVRNGKDKTVLLVKDYSTAVPVRDGVDNVEAMINGMNDALVDLSHQIADSLPKRASN